MTISPQTGQIDLKRSSKRRTLIRTTFSVHHASSDVAHQQTIGKHAVQPGIAADRFAECQTVRRQQIILITSAILVT